jgi:hypothetical protein
MSSEVSSRLIITLCGVPQDWNEPISEFRNRQFSCQISSQFLTDLGPESS